MSEKAQEVRQRRLEKMAYLKECVEIAFDFVLNEFDRKTEKGDYSPVSLTLTDDGIPTTNFENQCRDAQIGYCYKYPNMHNLFFEVLEKRFNDEEGFTAEFIHETNKLRELIVQIDFV